jgi:hypothetical protein
MSVKEILREIEALRSEQRWSVLEAVRRLVEPRFPSRLRRGWSRSSGAKGLISMARCGNRTKREPQTMSRGTRCGAWASAPMRFTVPDAENMAISLTPLCERALPGYLTPWHATQRSESAVSKYPGQRRPNDVGARGGATHRVGYFPNSLDTIKINLPACLGMQANLFA